MNVSASSALGRSPSTVADMSTSPLRKVMPCASKTVGNLAQGILVTGMSIPIGGFAGMATGSGVSLVAAPVAAGVAAYLGSPEVMGIGVCTAAACMAFGAALGAVAGVVCGIGTTIANWRSGKIFEAFDRPINPETAGRVLA